MEETLKSLDRKYILDHLTTKTYSVPGWDRYEIRIYFKGLYLDSIIVDGLELETWRYKDNLDGDSYTYDEFDEEKSEYLENKIKEIRDGTKT